MGWPQSRASITALSPAEESRFAIEIEEALVDELYDRARTSMVALFLMLLAVRAVLGDVYDRFTVIRALFYALYGLLAVRTVQSIIARKKQGYWASCKHRHIVFGVGSTGFALVFSLIDILAFPHLSVVQMCLLGMCLTGVNGVALLSLGSSPAIYFLYMLPSLLPFALLAALDYGPVSGTLLPLMTILFVAALSTMAIQDYKKRRENILLRLHVGEMALVDTLTKLRNRRYLEEFIVSEVEQVARRWKGPPSGLLESRTPPDPRRTIWVLMVDLDLFKQVNDVHGHEAGDAVLQQTAEVLRDAVRRQDVVTRWGGEEFVVVCLDHEIGKEPGTGEAPTEQGSVVAERIRARMAAHVFALPGGETIRRTCSVGYSVFPFYADDPTMLGWVDVLGLADLALYEAKRRGRNRVFGVLSGDKPWPHDRRELSVVKADVARASAEGLIRLVDPTVVAAE